VSLRQGCFKCFKNQQMEDCSAGIAAKTGYRSVSHFIETFKKHYGVTPKQAMTGYQFSSKAGY
jgi:AraC-like DNA-binding protein